MSLAAAAAANLTFSQHLVLWLHVAFVAFTIGPVTLAIMSTPRYIRRRDIKIVRYLSRITFIFMLGSLGVLIAGIFLAQMLHEAGKWWVIVSATLFVVAVLLLLLIVRDQRRAIRALAAEATAGATGPAGEQADAAADQREPTEPDHATSPGWAPDRESPNRESPNRESTEPIATAERARIAMTGGLVGLIWLVILVLMVWNS